MVTDLKKNEKNEKKGNLGFKSTFPLYSILKLHE